MPDSPPPTPPFIRVVISGLACLFFPPCEHMYTRRKSPPRSSDCQFLRLSQPILANVQPRCGRLEQRNAEPLTKFCNGLSSGLQSQPLVIPQVLRLFHGNYNTLSSSRLPLLVCSKATLVRRRRKEERRGACRVCVHFNASALHTVNLWQSARLLQHYSENENINKY